MKNLKEQLEAKSVLTSGRLLGVDLNQMAKTIYQQQIQKGWCKKGQQRDMEDLKVLALLEVSEACEAYRDGNYCSCMPNALGIIGAELACIDDKDVIESGKKDFKIYIKDTFEDEIADTAIRLFDIAGYLKLELGRIQLFATKPTGQFLKDAKTYIRFTSGILDHPIKSEHIMIGLNWCFSIANTYGFDLLTHIELKLLFNKTRPYRHGNKKA